MAALIPLGLLVGVLIGCIGIGGVLLVPSLVYVGGMDVHTAVASCLFSYLFSGGVGAVAFARRGSIRWSMSGWLCAGALPGAYLGALGLAWIPAAAIELLICGLIVFAGVYALGSVPETAAPRADPPNVRLGAIGLATGAGSSLSGTGGPLLLVPVLVWLRVPVLTAIGLSQVIQLPIAAAASTGNFLHGRIDFGVGFGVAALLVIGVASGARFAHVVPAGALKRAVAVALLVVGGLLAVRLAVQLIAG